MRTMPALLLLLFGATAVVAGADAAGQDAQLAELRARIDQLRTQITQRSGERDELTSRLREAERRIGRLAVELRGLDTELERRRRGLDALAETSRERQAALQQQRDALARQLRAAYVTGRRERLALLLNQHDAAAVGRLLVYHDYLGRERAARLADLRREIRHLQETEAQMRTGQQALERLQQARAEELAALRSAQAQRRAVLAKLMEELADRGREVTRLETDAKRLEALLGGLGTALDDVAMVAPPRPGFAGRMGRLPCPAGGGLVARFGDPRLGGLTWDGVIIAAAPGDEVRAVHHGRVAFADWLRGFGLLLIIDHGAGFMTLYGHNQGLMKDVGDWVDSGEPIALAGASGGREAAGVYFAIRRHGRAVDPASWCRNPHRAARAAG